MKKIAVAFFFLPGLLFAQSKSKGDEARTDESAFKQLQQELPTPNVYRTASGAPGHAYWQQRADYDMAVTLDDENQRITGRETITYTNHSPDPLDYLWVQLDQNVRAKDSDTYKTETGTLDDVVEFRDLSFVERDVFDGGFKISAVREKSGATLPYTINRTMMRVDLPRTLKPGGSYSFQIEWSYNVQDQPKLGGRSGYEYFPEDDNRIYEIAQFYPRMAVYDDVNGWQHKQFLGNGEFTLPFGNYKVSITAPADHVVAATGELQNASQVLTSTQRQRLEKAKGAKNPVVIVTQEEATANEKSRANNTKTWVFQASDVRDFAWASSRKFIWDAMQVNIGGKKTWAMSYYPKEGNPLWGQYSTEVVAHTLRVYSKHTIDYPYPVAISVHGPVYGMEYPMICFNGGRPEPDGTYSERTKYGMISVIIHEVGHNFFPMIINSDERQWTWMDEGFNTFVQFLTEQEWEKNYPSRRGEAQNITAYMGSSKDVQVPIMTNSESILQFGNNAYAKPATALNVLRETVLGRELFDYAFKTYAQRWAFKHPKPADFFRTMEDASGTDLDWFWRGWFYTTDHVDIALTGVKWLQLNTQDPAVEKPLARTMQEKEPRTLTQQRNAELKTLVEEKPELKDFYNQYDALAITDLDKEQYQRYYNSLSNEEKEMLAAGLNFYQLDFENLGGLVMPLIVKMEFEDGTEEVLRIPAEIWRYNNHEVSKIIYTKKAVTSFTLDPYLETADTDRSNNFYPPQLGPSRFQMYKRKRSSSSNPMQLYSTPSSAPAQPQGTGR
ncbi:Peptidase family M1 [Catalinimonas alkaloidigena]|uniref:Peptidase family M1 n=1 Tax=Catalinimonas alkaloidigena TaxID=1075417 RepID=A0A1G9MPK4_9BACT|nr:M1 family metallopeptidase [Catalinimonas alkaloidigena]SDL76180.1 Peptidase family M1 [Catalinimonas alkaloidigena]